MAERLGCDLAARGLVIFSGLAGGVDSAAHRGAVAGKGKTVAVFGTGVDQIYPKENSRLVDQILALGGALISEFADRKSTRLNSSHSQISYAVFCLKKKRYLSPLSTVATPPPTRPSRRARNRPALSRTP